MSVLVGRIVSLCDRSGNWPHFYRLAGYEVITLDLANGDDVRLLERIDGVRGVMAAPPCTVFANSGARWKRTDDDMRAGLSVVDACVRFIVATKPVWWAIENPVGKLSRYLGKPRMYFDPCDYGDPYTKRTALWGDFKIPKKTPVEPTLGSMMHKLPPSDDRAIKRSITPLGFARAWFEANP